MKFKTNHPPEENQPVGPEEPKDTVPPVHIGRIPSSPADSSHRPIQGPTDPPPTFPPPSSSQ
jgi:hypothetical protein